MYNVIANLIQHSLENKSKDENHQAELTILFHKSGDNDIVAEYEYNGVKYTAIYNCFNGQCQCYVDDVYGIIEDESED